MVVALATPYGQTGWLNHLRWLWGGSYLLNAWGACLVHGVMGKVLYKCPYYPIKFALWLGMNMMFIDGLCT